MDDNFSHHHDDPLDGHHSGHHDDLAAYFDPHGHDQTHHDPPHHGWFWTEIHTPGDHHEGFSIFGRPLQPLIDTILEPYHGGIIDSLFHLPAPHHGHTTLTGHSSDSALGTIGHPEADSAWWHLQQHDDTCAVVSQQFILDSLTHGQGHFSEDQLQREAAAHGWYTPGGGTPLYHVGDLIAYHGFEVHKEHGATLQHLAHELHQDHKVIVGVHAEDIWDAVHGSANTPLSDYPGIPGHQSNHAVEVIGINDDDPMHPVIILNDPGTPDGKALHVPADVFMNAWSASNNFMVNTTGNPVSIDRAQV